MSKNMNTPLHQQEKTKYMFKLHSGFDNAGKALSGELKIPGRRYVMKHLPRTYASDSLVGHVH